MAGFPMDTIVEIRKGARGSAEERREGNEGREECRERGLSEW
jgi:hypothetical protein